MASSSSRSGVRTVDEFIFDGLNYEAAMEAYNAQFTGDAGRSSFGWFTSAVNPPASDLDVERALRARQEFFQSQESLLTRYTPQ